MVISDTGKNLSICIGCDYSPHFNWMTFLCWYSIQKNIPDAKVYISCFRKNFSYEYFNWTKRCKIPFSMTSNEDWEKRIKNSDEKTLYISGNNVCVSDLFEFNSINDVFMNKKIANGDDFFSGDCKEDKNYLFVTYKNGWGSFVLSNWINKNGSPFFEKSNFKYGSMTINEMRINKLWVSAASLFKETT